MKLNLESHAEALAQLQAEVTITRPRAGVTPALGRSSDPAGYPIDRPLTKKSYRRNVHLLNVLYHLMAKTRRATLKDVSAGAGVSLFTVSRALSGHSGVAQATRERVRRVAEDLGYVANQHARSLKGQHSQVIGVLVASKQNQYYATLVGAIEEAVEMHGYTCAVADAVMNGIYLPEREDRIIEWLIEQRVAAVVLTYAVAEENIARLAIWDIQVLFADCLPPASHASLPSVTTDNSGASLAVGRHFANLGYRDWCFVGHAKNWNTREPRQRGFEAAAQACGATICVVEGGNDAEIARRGVTALWARLAPGSRPQAIYASNTVLLKGVLLALRDLNLIVPRDVAVVAFDDFDWATLLSPPLTVIDQHIALIGRTAGSQILALLGETHGNAGSNVIVAPTLIVRESCGAQLPPNQRPGADGASRFQHA